MNKTESKSMDEILNEQLAVVEARLAEDLHDIVRTIREREAAFKHDERGYSLVNPAASGCPAAECPFCGYPNITAHVDAVEGKAHRAYLTCDHCGVVGPEFVTEEGQSAPYVVQCAATLWNRRTTIIGRG